MPKYAKNTSVSVNRSIEEIERILKRYKASQFITGRDDETGRALVGFKVEAISYKVEIPIPDRADFKLDKRGWKRTDSAIEKDWEQAYRQRWRVMALVIKAKLEAVECGISTFEQEFMTNIILPGGQTIREFLAPQLIKAIESGNLPRTLPMLEILK